MINICYNDIVKFETAQELLLTLMGLSKNKDKIEYENIKYIYNNLSISNTKYNEEIAKKFSSEVKNIKNRLNYND